MLYDRIYVFYFEDALLFVIKHLLNLRRSEKVPGKWNPLYVEFDCFTSYSEVSNEIDKTINLIHLEYEKI